MLGRFGDEQIGVVRVHGQHGASPARVGRERARQPRGGLPEGIGRRVVKPLEEQSFVAPQHFDQPRARAVGAGGDLTDERRGLWRGAANRGRSNHEQPLSGLKVESHAHGEVAVRRQHRVEFRGRHTHCYMRPGRFAHRSADQTDLATAAIPMAQWRSLRAPRRAVSRRREHGGPNGDVPVKSLPVVIALSLLCVTGEVGATAQQPAPESTPAAKPAQAAPAESKTELTVPKEESSVTKHTTRINGRSVSYTATASTTLLKNDAGEPEALMYSTAYIEDGVTDFSHRPIAFVYNGGPGSSSIWLHIGAFGPRHIVTDNAQPTPPAPYQMADNNDSLLDKADLVFIDPVGTGFSHAAGKAQDKDFWGVDPDVKSLAQFISIYLSRNGRWNSPKLLIGESYGTFRLAALADYLQSTDGIYVNGIVLLSSVLDFSTLRFNTGNDRGYVLYLPTYAAVAWHYNLLQNRPAELPAFLDEARQFASTDYAAALMKGSSLAEADKTRIAAKMAAFTGLSQDYLVKANLRVSLPQFQAELLRSRGVSIGRYDGRYNAAMYDVLEEYADADPWYSAVLGAFTAGFNAYVRDDLKFGKDLRYDVLPEAPSEHWDWKGSIGSGPVHAPNVEDNLVEALRDNPQLQVQVENGYFDLATPFFATEYTMDHLMLPGQARDRIHLQYYEAGHMMYLHQPDLDALSANVRTFIDQVSRQ